MTIDTFADALNCAESLSEHCNLSVQRRYVRPRAVPQNRSESVKVRSDYLPASSPPADNVWETLFVFPYPTAGASRQRSC
jgi:hypothetical protein